MIDAILIGTLLGTLSGIVPGPYTALVAGKALQRGFAAGARLALVPLATEIPPMAAATLTLTRADQDVLQWIGVGGGLLFIALGVRLFLKDDETGAEGSGGESEDGGSSARTCWAWQRRDSSPPLRGSSGSSWGGRSWCAAIAAMAPAPPW